ncbi:small glutamine-rich tetratricopeptide repeat-containing protein beta-like [Toxorhynchites rutilus septentrionalis]|uniref:small glutamine-rich tetratricopeptide repeat-containing protein beta-like n=1 Tax=Toxorhynchites rutilus septentrionalis TaxID=329112 RepID=UPI002478B6EB|nr:small glutamine-rich tetratricopeptide repeat-containing protein beta-like [Toxorhynchites rutilus septentrionalis]
MTDIDQKYFVRSFIRFLNGQIEQPSFSSDSRESLEVAIQCLENVYEIGQEEGDDGKDNPLNHVDLYEVYRSTFTNVSPERKQEAENLKNEGNRLMKEGKYQEALNTYSKAISLDATNPVFYCNRAAAYSRMEDYQSAANDCRMSLRYDPNYSKAYGRLGLANSKMNKHEQALEAYQNALRIEPDNQDYINNMSVTQQRLEEQRNAPVGAAGVGAGGMPNLGVGGLGGIDFAAALNNPALVHMATRMMNDPAVQNMLGHLSGMDNVDALLETGRQLAMQMSNQNPDVFANVIRQMEQGGGGGGFPANGNGAAPNATAPDNNQNSNGNNDNAQQPPPPADS